MKNLRTAIAIIVSILSVNFTTKAQDVATNKTKFSIEIDPVTFAAKGYGVHFRIQPKNSEHLLLGIGTYALDIPSFLVNMNDKNKDKGWNVRANQGYGIFGEYHFKEVNRKLFVGTQIALQETKIEKEGETGSKKFTNLVAMGYFGYTFKPFKNNLYIKPWAGVGYNSKVSGTNVLGNATYDNAAISYLLTLHLGYTFK